MAKAAALLVMFGLEKTLMLIVLELPDSSMHLLNDKMVLFIPSVVEGTHAEPVGLHRCIMSSATCLYDIAHGTHHRPRIYGSWPRDLWS